MSVEINIATIIHPPKMKPYLLIYFGDGLFEIFCEPISIIIPSRRIDIRYLPVVHAIKGIGHQLIVDQGGQYRSRYGSRHPFPEGISGKRNLFSFSFQPGGIYAFPSAVEIILFLCRDGKKTAKEQRVDDDSFDRLITRMAV
jgi:hypothetical protein